MRHDFEDEITEPEAKLGPEASSGAGARKTSDPQPRSDQGAAAPSFFTLPIRARPVP